MIYGPLNGEMTDFSYDCRNRLIQAGDTKYEYDAENNRTTVIKNAGTDDETTTRYTVDRASGELTQVVKSVETDKDGTEKVLYYYYADNKLVAQEQYESAESSSHDENAENDSHNQLPTILTVVEDTYLTYHFNNVGSTTAVTDEDRSLVYEYKYSPYGDLITGEYGQVSFLYNGQYGVTSDDNRLYYMRTRYYNVDIKRFVNQDVLTGSIDSSPSLNRYAYVEGNPVSYIDPLGLEKKDNDGWFQLFSGYWYKIKNGGGQLKESRDFLNVNACLSAAIDIVVNDYITGMTIQEVAAEIYFHAVIYYKAIPIEKLKILGISDFAADLIEHTVIIDFEHGGESVSGAKAAYEILWNYALLTNW